MTVISVRKTVVVAALVLSLIAAAAYAFAGPGRSGDTKPGWGLGNPQHENIGPPGSTIAQPPRGFPTPRR